MTAYCVILKKNQQNYMNCNSSDNIGIKLYDFVSVGIGLWINILKMFILVHSKAVSDRKS